MKLLDSELRCRSCGGSMSCLLTGPDAQPETMATYYCNHCDPAHGRICGRPPLPCDGTCRWSGAREDGEPDGR